MEPLPTVLSIDTGLERAAELLARSDHGVLPVVRAAGDYLGCVTAQAVAEELGRNGGGLAELVERPATVTTGTSLVDALDALVSAHGSGLQVLCPDGSEPVGWISDQALLVSMRDQAAPPVPIPATMAG